MILLIGSVFLFAKIKADKGLIQYTNSNGDNYKFTRSLVYNTTFYGVNFLANGITYNYQ